MNTRATPPDEVPEDELAFNFRSGRLCLAFVATVGQRWAGNYERLRTPSDFARWCQEAGLLDQAITVTESALDAARSLREAIHRGAKALLGGEAVTTGDEAVVNAAAAAPPLIPELHDGAGRLVAGAADADWAVLSTVARDAIDLFTGPYADRIRECDSPECALLFVDTSRPGRRRWCSSDACGTKGRSAAYRRRQSS